MNGLVALLPLSRDLASPRFQTLPGAHVQAVYPVSTSCSCVGQNVTAISNEFACVAAPQYQLLTWMFAAPGEMIRPHTVAPQTPGFPNDLRYYGSLPLIVDCC